MLLAETPFREPAAVAADGRGRPLTSLAARAKLAAALAAAECIALALVDHPQLPVRHAMAGPVCFFLALLFFGRPRLAGLSLPRAIDRRFLALHIFAATVLLACETIFLSHPGIHPPAITLAWSAAVITLLASLLFCLFPGNLAKLTAALGRAWAYSAIIALPFFYIADKYDGLWNGSSDRIGGVLQRFTFTCVSHVLDLLYGASISVPASSVLGTTRFQVEIAPGCSGMEGIALVLLLTTAWLIYYRDRLRIERALLLIPLALLLAFALNITRIVALVAIGDAGHADVAVHGFHSEAGWLSFNLVAAGFLLLADRVRWFHRTSAQPFLASTESTNVASVFLLPFLAVVTVSMVTRALSSGFDWLYPLRPALALLVLWHYRREYRRLDWRFGWLGPLFGAIVFALWVALAHWQHAVPSELGDHLAHLGTPQRIAWITIRVVAAALVVPVVEELAFRGYLARRLISPDVSAVPFDRLTLGAIAISSIAFGLLHGRLWPAGCLAGVAFAVVCRMRNRLGEAVAAHATANVLLAVWVLGRHDYALW